MPQLNLILPQLNLMNKKTSDFDIHFLHLPAQVVIPSACAARHGLPEVAAAVAAAVTAVPHRTQSLTSTGPAVLLS